MFRNLKIKIYDFRYEFSAINFKIQIEKHSHIHLTDN